MPRQERKSTKPTTAKEEPTAEQQETAADEVAAVKGRDDAVTVDEVDDWLDMIDEALEDWAATSELAQAFVASYVQKGGE
jgi:ubiquitin-like protein Pup